MGDEEGGGETEKGRGRGVRDRGDREGRRRGGRGREKTEKVGREGILRGGERGGDGEW